MLNQVSAGTDYREDLARSFEPRPRRYSSPLALARAVDRKTGTSPALEVIDAALVELTSPGCPDDALEISMPPQEGKSQITSRRFTEWLLDHDDSIRIAVVSYEQDIALRWGRDVKQDISLHPCRHQGGGKCEEACGGLHIPIRRDSAAAGRWETPGGGGMYCVGVGGPLAGRPVDILVIDDPVKDRAAAESKTIRNSTWDWWESVALTRLAPGAKVVLIQTRWHEDDLAGRIASRPSPLKWRRLRIPAIADSPDDPLGRAPGEELPSVRKRVSGYFRNLLATMSAYVFSGIYQQKPVAPEGNFFRRASFRYWRPAEAWPDGRERIWCEGQEYTLADCYRFITMDFAASTKSGADWTVAACWAITPDGHLILLDRRRKRVPDHEHFAMAMPLIARWNAELVYVEQNWWSSTFVEDARAAGVPIAPLLADTDKVTRAIPAAGRIHSGRVWFPAETSGCECGSCVDGVWLDEFCDELAIFPQGSNDDQVDVTSYAARVQSHEWTPAKTPERPGRHQWDDVVTRAGVSATGNGALDLSRVQY
jgi:phage terminase large subunit-like protein